jgi:hypothetical protein
MAATWCVKIHFRLNWRLTAIPGRSTIVDRKESGLFGAVAAFATFSIPFQPSDGRRNSSMMALLVRVDASVVFLYHN